MKQENRECHMEIWRWDETHVVFSLIESQLKWVQNTELNSMLWLTQIWGRRRRLIAATFTSWNALNVITFVCAVELFLLSNNNAEIQINCVKSNMMIINFILKNNQKIYKRKFFFENTSSHKFSIYFHNYSH